MRGWGRLHRGYGERDFRLVEKVFIRTDANQTVAGGHVMRCLSVADALSARGTEVGFVLSDDGPAGAIRERGYGAEVLGTDWRRIMEGAYELASACDGVHGTVAVLIDTYAVTPGYVDLLAGHARVCYLGSKAGDLGGLSLLVNYSTDADERLYGRVYGRRGTRLLLGPRYAPLGKRFGSVYRARDGSIERVLVTTGSTDPDGFVPAFLSAAIGEASLEAVEFVAVAGGMFDEEEVADMERLAGSCRRVRVVRGATDLAPLMGECDAAVSAGGTTVYELAAAGVPAVVFSMVPEQVQGAESMGALGAIRYAGPMGGRPGEAARRCVDLIGGLAADPVAARRLALRAHALIDGNGAERIAEELIVL